MFDWLARAEAVAALTAVFSAIATGLAVWAAIEGPKRAAKLAEELRSQGDAYTDKRRARMHVFSLLMANRQSYWWGEPLQAFNLIDVVFNDAPSVRAAWSEMFLALQDKTVPEHIRNEKLRALLGAMAKNLNLADELRVDDFGRVYRSEAAILEQMVATMQRQQAYQRLMGESASPSANAPNAQEPPGTMFPPKPE